MSRGRGGNGGSHFGGSSSPRGAGGSGSSGGGHFRGSNNHSGPVGPAPGGPRGGFHMQWGWGPRRYHHGSADYSGPAPTFMAWFIIGIVLLFFAIPLFSLANSASHSLNVIKSDYDYYQEMIEYTDTHTNHIIMATITGKYKNYDVNKWYLEFTLIDDHSLLSQEGAYIRSSYSIYSDEQISKYHVGDKIAVAVDSVPITIITDAVVMEYRNFDLEDDGEYQQILKSQTNFRVWAIVLIVAGGACFLIGIIFAVKFGKDLKQYNENSSENTSTSETDNEGNIQTKKASYCQYCGCKAEEGRKKCEHCGANLK